MRSRAERVVLRASGNDSASVRTACASERDIPAGYGTGGADGGGDSGRLAHGLAVEAVGGAHQGGRIVDAVEGEVGVGVVRAGRIPVDVADAEDALSIDWRRLTFWTRSTWVVRSRRVAMPVRIWIRRSVTR